MNFLQGDIKDDKEISLVVQYQQQNKNFTLQVPKNIVVGEIVQELSQLIEKSPLTMSLYKEKQLLNVQKSLSTYDITDKGTVLSLQVQSKGGFIIN